VKTLVAMEVMGSNLVDSKNRLQQNQHWSNEGLPHGNLSSALQYHMFHHLIEPIVYHLSTYSWIVPCLVNFQLGATCHRCSGDTCHLFIFPCSFTFDFFPSLTGTLTTYKFFIRTLFEVKFSPLEICHQALRNYGIFREILII
jgi:hypothetical protein